MSRDAIHAMVNQDPEKYCAGVCPKCGDAVGPLFWERCAWFYCPEHKARWEVQSSRQDYLNETRREWLQGRAILSDFSDVEPIIPNDKAYEASRRQRQESNLLESKRMLDGIVETWPKLTILQQSGVREYAWLLAQGDDFVGTTHWSVRFGPDGTAESVEYNDSGEADDSGPRTREGTDGI